MWLVCICFFGVFLKLRNFDKNHLMPLQWLSVLCIITKSVLSLKFSFCSSYKSSVSWKSTQDRDWSEKRKNWTPMMFFLLCFTQHAVDFCDDPVLTEHTVAWQALRLAREVCFRHSQIRLSVVFKLQITMITAPNCTSWQHWANNGPHDQPYI